ncbi:hypothetical protein C5167_026203 [Papaver somniferum]|nr:hypothetical protein C5167_026203 [Papaver somniferum]
MASDPFLELRRRRDKKKQNTGFRRHAEPTYQNTSFRHPAEPRKEPEHKVLVPRSLPPKNRNSGKGGYNHDEAVIKIVEDKRILKKETSVFR